MSAEWNYNRRGGSRFENQPLVLEDRYFLPSLHPWAHFGAQNTHFGRDRFLVYRSRNREGRVRLQAFHLMLGFKSGPPTRTTPPCVTLPLQLPHLSKRRDQIWQSLKSKKLTINSNFFSHPRKAQMSPTVILKVDLIPQRQRQGGEPSLERKAVFLCDSMWSCPLAWAELDSHFLGP